MRITMEIEKSKYKQKCELGACKNTADYTVRFERSGIRAQLHVCRACVEKLHAVTGSVVEANCCAAEQSPTAEKGGAKAKEKRGA